MLNTFPRKYSSAKTTIKKILKKSMDKTRHLSIYQMIFGDKSFLKKLYYIKNPKNKYNEQLRLARDILHNGSLPTDFSINLGVAPCNHSCLFCPQSIHKPKKAAWLDLNILDKVANELPNSGITVNISSYSETLSAPNLVDSIKILKKVRPKLSIVMATNGSLMRENIVQDLVDAGLDYYSYSFDAPDRESYAKLMQVDHFDRVWSNLEKIVEIRNSNKSKMKILTHIMGFDAFKDKYPDFEAYWKNKVDNVRLRPVGNWGGGSWGLEENLSKAGFTIPDVQIPKERYPCTSIFMHFKLQHDGRYAPCVAAVPDYLPEEELHNVPYLGNANDITWLDAWHNLSKMRKAHLNGDWKEFSCCSTCNIWALWPNIWTENDQLSIGKNRFELIDLDHAS